ncbi:LytR/AlgR family response regulator transcription factor [Patiriisocius hiemis]|uniref:LytTR family DNA-binding domain-containing protein n=1 Tax=Patiriisocius hiemis TaxID=3075604 RepID=A0ABU2YET5_9FLAO|nr:LytTR family DNA-binding domain-containing protein [Constantimarinum sp. W242]MDT0556527.1 LytTR family DNA-binding domain-containing protein [Constantimarinum sp. W242]
MLLANQKTYSILFLFFIGNILYAQSLLQVNDKIQQGITNRDTLSVNKEINNANKLINSNSFSEVDSELLKFQYLKTFYEIKYSKIEIDSGLKEYERIQEICSKEGYHKLNATILGRIANGYRSKRQLGKAYEFNQKEIKATKKSKDSVLVARALITELDIAYNSLPWPLQNSDLDKLIEKGQIAIKYAQEKSLNDIAQFGKLYVSKFYTNQGGFKEASKLLLGISDSETLSIVFSKYEHLCEIAKLQGNRENYRKYSLRFKKYAYATHRPFVELNANNYLLDYNLKFGISDSTRHYATLLEKNLAIVDTTKYLDFLDVSYNTLAAYYNGKDTQKQLKYTQYSAQVNKTIAERQKEAFMAIELYKQDVESLEFENIALNESKSSIKKNLTIVLVALFGLLLVLFFIYKGYQKSKVETASVVKEKEILSEKVKQKSIELHNKQRIYLKDLLFVKVDGNYVEFFTSEKKILDRSTLTEILKKLPPNFLQVHRSYVINTNYIASISGTTIRLKNGEEIPFSRSFKSKLKNKL